MNWADDVDDDVSPDAPRIEEKDEGNGIRVITEYRTNAEGKKVKVTVIAVFVRNVLTDPYDPVNRSPDVFEEPLSPPRSMQQKQRGNNGLSLARRKVDQQGLNRVRQQ